ncbi:MAG: protein-L-isoaspartate(D-aspartate) O-methyltransferase [Kiloniellales bacterium]
MAESTETQLDALREQMVEQVALHATVTGEQTGRELLDDRVLAAMQQVPRHSFVPSALKLLAYIDSPLPIGYGKTISQPFIVALMLDLLQPQPDDRVLEVGTGLGYQAAILAELVATVYSVEIIEELAREAANRVGERGYANIELRTGDGGQGWPEHAPFDKIIVAAAPELMPPPLLNQLKPGGRMVIPAGIPDRQQLMLVEKDIEGRYNTTEVLPVRFAPLVTAH